MEFLITESQLRLLLQEEEKSQLGLYVKNMYAFTKQMLNKVFKSYGINLRMLQQYIFSSTKFQDIY